jgi:hypothetical protein
VVETTAGKIRGYVLRNDPEPQLREAYKQVPDERWP